MRRDLTARLDGLDTRLRAVETGLADLRGRLDGMDGQFAFLREYITGENVRGHGCRAEPDRGPDLRHCYLGDVDDVVLTGQRANHRKAFAKHRRPGSESVVQLVNSFFRCPALANWDTAVKLPISGDQVRGRQLGTWD